MYQARFYQGAPGSRKFHVENSEGGRGKVRSSHSETGWTSTFLTPPYFLFLPPLFSFLWLSLKYTPLESFTLTHRPELTLQKKLRLIRYASQERSQGESGEGGWRYVTQLIRLGKEVRHKMFCPLIHPSRWSELDLTWILYPKEPRWWSSDGSAISKIS